MKIMITGSSGFIGFHLSRSLLEDGHHILGIDNMNDYYAVSLKERRLEILKKYKNFSFELIDLIDYSKLIKSFKNFKPTKVINLAAQAGVRYSLKNPNAYIDSNIKGFMNVLECCRHNNIEGLIYASSSSVYGGNTKIPFSVEDSVDNPISIYAATKKANELMANSYGNLFKLKTTGLRFFTVYGPWGRPDMALFIFTKKIISGEPIPVFNHGKMKRDFTYIDDIINGTKSALEKNYFNEIFNLGNHKSENLMDLIHIIEDNLSMKAKIEFYPMQKGDVSESFADIKKSTEFLDFKPKINIDVGVKKFIEWYRKEYNV